MSLPVSYDWDKLRSWWFIPGIALIAIGVRAVGYPRDSRLGLGLALAGAAASLASAYASTLVRRPPIGAGAPRELTPRWRRGGAAQISNYWLVVLALVPTAALACLLAAWVHPRTPSSAVAPVPVTAATKAAAVLTLAVGYETFAALSVTLVGLASYLVNAPYTEWGAADVNRFFMFLAIFLGTLAAAGCLVVWAKMAGVIISKSYSVPGHRYLLALLVALSIGLLVPFEYMTPVDGLPYILAIIGVAAVCGFVVSLAAMEKDLLVCYALLVSLLGWAMCATGFTILGATMFALGANPGVVVADILIAAGAIIGVGCAVLVQSLCRTHGRRMRNVLSTTLLGDVSAGRLHQQLVEYTEIDVNELARRLIEAQNIVIVPGYGLAVAQAQFVLSDVVTLLRENGKRVIFDIHPVAGRVPGHMNLLLSEAGVPSEIIFDMEQAAPHLPSADVALVIGANDSVNPAAADPTSNLGNMPVIEVWRARSTVVIKRTLARGFSNVPNPLFARHSVAMLFSDAKTALVQLSSVLHRWLKRRSIASASASAPASRRASLELSAKAPRSGEQIEQERYEQREASISAELLSLPSLRTVGVPAEVDPNECRVAVTPDACLRLRRDGFAVLVQTGAGARAHFSDADYERRGATVVADAQYIWQTADIIVKVRPPQVDPQQAQPVHEASLLRDSPPSTVIALFGARLNDEELHRYFVEKHARYACSAPAPTTVSAAASGH